MCLYLSARMESWLIEIDLVGRHAGSYTEGSTRNHVNDGKTNNLGWMLYPVYAVVSVYAVLSVCCTQCKLMMMAWRDREGWLNLVFCNDHTVVDENVGDGGWRWEWCAGYEWIWEIRGTTCLIGLGRPCIGVITRQIGTHTCCIVDGKLTSTQNSLKSHFLMMVSPISSHLSLSRPQLYQHLRTRI